MAYNPTKSSDPFFDEHFAFAGNQDIAPKLITPAAGDAGPTQSGVSLPFGSLDPYSLDGKDDLPDGHLSQGAGGGLSSNVEEGGGPGETQIGFELELYGHSFMSDEGFVDIMSLTDMRSTEMVTITLDGQTIPMEYKSHQSFGFEGRIYDQDLRAVTVEMHTETFTEFQAETFDADGNPLITSYSTGKVLELFGEAMDFGIEEFELTFEMSIELEMNDFGFYTMTFSVMFEGEITYLNGGTSLFEFLQEEEFMFSSLDNVEMPELSDQLLMELSRFFNGMGEAWDAIDLLNDHLEAVLLKLKEDGHYDGWDFVDQGLDNPFDGQLPELDWTL